MHALQITLRTKVEGHRLALHDIRKSVVRRKVGVRGAAAFSRV
jgi:hypothetical protein